MGGLSMEEIDIHAKLAQIETAPHFSMIFDGDTEKAEMIAEHLMWLHSIRRERPLVSRPYKVGIYIRYFNQTRYDNYLDFHKKGFIDTIGLCPKWELVDFYLQTAKLTDPYSGKQCDEDASRLSIQVHVDALNKGLLLIL